VPRLIIGTTKLVGNEYRFYFCYGPVLENKTWSETHVSGGSNSDGSISVSSSVYRHSQLWLAPEQGVEDCTELVDVDIPIRKGQIAGVLACLPAGEDSGPIVHVSNFTTEHTVFLDCGIKKALRNVKLVPMPRFVFPLALTALYGAILYRLSLAQDLEEHMLLNALAGVSLVVVAFLIVKWLVKRAAMNDLRASIDKVLDDYFRKVAGELQINAVQTSQSQVPIQATPVSTDRYIRARPGL
jgi:hypothetical protein